MKLAIIGGGIGGLSTALALSRLTQDAASQISIELFERAPRITEVGAGLSLWPNATHALRELGVLDDCLARGARLERILIRRDDGKLLMDMPLEEYPTPAIAMHRADLVHVLVEKIPPQIIRLGRKIISLEETGAGVLLHSSTESFGPFDAVIGADGLHSIARTFVRRSASDEPDYRGYVVWRGIAHLPLASSGFETWGRGCRFGALPIGGDRVYWYATQNRACQDADEMETQSEKQLDDLTRRFGSWHRPIPDVLASTPRGQILTNLCFDRTPARGWSRGGVLLMGDAAHPTTPNMGQGGCMALEDAVVLAKILDERGALARSFEEFEARRFARTAKIVKESRQIGDVGQWENPIAVFFRDFTSQLLPGKALAANYRSLYGFKA